MKKAIGKSNIRELKWDIECEFNKEIGRLVIKGEGVLEDYAD